MPRANRYILPGHIYHLTHRCHDRQFLFRFAKDRNGYRRRLREAARGLAVSILTYNITSHHVHVVAYAEDPEAIATLMQQAAGELARDYNRRKPNGPKPLPWGSEPLSKRSRLRSIAPANGCDRGGR